MGDVHIGEEGEGFMFVGVMVGGHGGRMLKNLPSFAGRTGGQAG